MFSKYYSAYLQSKLSTITYHMYKTNEYEYINVIFDSFYCV